MPTSGVKGIRRWIREAVVRGSGRRTGGMPETSWDPVVGPASLVWERVVGTGSLRSPSSPRGWSGCVGWSGLVTRRWTRWRHRWIGTQRGDRDGAERDLSPGFGLPRVGEQCPANRRAWGGSGSCSVGVGGALGGGVGAVAPSAAGHCSTHRFDGCGAGVQRLESVDEPDGRDWNAGILLRTLSGNRVPGPLWDRDGQAPTPSEHSPTAFLLPSLPHGFRSGGFTRFSNRR